jgi:hypothetical protein
LILYSRSFEEDPNYFPDWRSLQAREYEKHYEEAQAARPQQDFFLPDEEDDDFVRDYFSLLTVGDCNNDSVKYGHLCQQSNRTRGFGTLMRSMLVGGCSLERIAKEMFTSEENVDAYFKLFFDMKRYLDCSPLMSFVLVPFMKTEDSFSHDRQNSMWLSLSYAFGWDKAKFLLQRRVDVDAATVSLFTESLANCINLQAAEFAMSVRTGGVARPADFERHIALTNATAMTQASQNESMSSNAESFRNALFGIVSEKAQALPASHPVRQMLSEKATEVIEIEESSSRTKKKFGISPIRHL